MATNSTYFVALCSFVATRYAEAGIQLDDIEREELPLTLSTFLNTISNGLRDPIPEKRKRRAPTKAANASHTSAGTGIPARVYLQALFPNTSAARDGTGTTCPNANMTALINRESGPIAKLASAIYAIDQVFHKWVVHAFPSGFSWASPLDNSYSQAELTTFFNLITLSYNLHTLRTTLKDLNTHLKSVSRKITAFSAALSFLLGILIHISESHGVQIPPNLPFTFKPVDETDYRCPFPGITNQSHTRPPHDHYFTLIKNSILLRHAVTQLSKFITTTLASHIRLAVMSLGALSQSPPGTIDPSLLCPGRLGQLADKLGNMEVISMEQELKPFLQRLENHAAAVKEKLAGWDLGDQALAMDTTSLSGSYVEMLAGKFGEVQTATLGSGGWMIQVAEEGARVVGEVAEGYRLLRLREYC
ncbi:LOW QUALITY PROTEIN: uncharacterized protein QC763_501210 [Podospora pseudopauciseta]|uniref:Uncharacterized protein n=1 Tax=Podospora pseudopauciseta TaxID=2093780 RepID=A0ABR0H7F0_9PEZI|nr:LOW QUALITY PROTEIN: hypothetical protein QC763_501210 [Podospora pseudopauciseta]